MKVVHVSSWLLRKVKKRVADDFLSCRGTLHIKQVTKALASLKALIHSLEAQVTHLEKDLSLIISGMKNELEKALITHLVKEELKQLPEIGPTLAQKIISQCFDGSLASLLRASQLVKGVGEKRQAIIRDWIKSAEERLPSLLQTDFPQKDEIEKRYAERITTIKAQITTLRAKVSQLKILEVEAEKHLAELKTVTSETFSQAFSGDEIARRRVERYIIGLFPPWEKPPHWLRELLEKIR